jgi:hypothetical protein
MPWRWSAKPAPSGGRVAGRAGRGGLRGGHARSGVGLAPGVLLVTLKITVQLPLAGIVMLVKLSEVAPAAKSVRSGPHAGAGHRSALPRSCCQRVGERAARQRRGVAVGQRQGHHGIPAG